jgi:hypothetical protein
LCSSHCLEDYLLRKSFQLCTGNEEMACPHRPLSLRSFDIENFKREHQLTLYLYNVVLYLNIVVSCLNVYFYIKTSFTHSMGVQKKCLHTRLLCFASRSQRCYIKMLFTFHRSILKSYDAFV